MRKVFQSIMFLLFLTTLISCKDNNSPSNELSSGGTLKITASSGTTQVFYRDAKAGVNFFVYTISEPSSTNNNTYSVSLKGFCNAGQAEVYFAGTNTIQIGKTYSCIYKNKLITGEASIQLSDWISDDFGATGSKDKSVKGTVQFSKFQYPGEIKGIVVNYDINDKIVANG